MASAPARVVTVSSGAQSSGRIDFDDLMGERKYSGSRAYDRSKLANVMFTYELARRLEGTGVTATALHPGLTNTAFSGEDPARAFASIVAFLRPFMRSPERGADTAVYLASSADVEGVSGRYFANRKARTSHKSSTTHRLRLVCGRPAPIWSACRPVSRRRDWEPPAGARCCRRDPRRWRTSRSRLASDRRLRSGPPARSGRCR